MQGNSISNETTGAGTLQEEKIVIRGAREHNLKSINLEIPRNRLIVFTGVSGSGKSSLAFDTLYSEGQRRYVESLSAYARQFLGQMERPEVDFIEGLSPAISIEQKTVNRNPRSTVATITEIYDYMRVLFARIGTPHCIECGREVGAQTTDEIIDKILELPEGKRIQILAPIAREQKGEYKDDFEAAMRAGYARARVDGQMYELTDDIGLDRNMRHNIEIVVDRIIMREGIRSRVAESVEAALELGEGTMIVNVLPSQAGMPVPPDVGRMSVLPDEIPPNPPLERGGTLADDLQKGGALADDAGRMSALPDAETPAPRDEIPPNPPLERGGILADDLVKGEILADDAGRKSVPPDEIPSNPPLERGGTLADDLRNGGTFPTEVGPPEVTEVGPPEVTEVGSPEVTEAKPPEATEARPPGEEDILFNKNYACPVCGISYEELTPQMFSFNSPQGMCPSCRGLGIKMEMDPDLVVPDKSRSINEGAIALIGEPTGLWIKHFLAGVAKHYGFSLDTPWSDLTEEQQNVVLYGSGKTRIKFIYKSHNGRAWPHTNRYRGIIPDHERKLRDTDSDGMREHLSKFVASVPCHECNGGRIRRESMAVTIGGRSIVDVVRMSVDKAADFFDALLPQDTGKDERKLKLATPLTGTELLIGEELIKEIRGRLGFLQDVGLNYITLDRTAPTLSGGESQRIRLASQIGSGLVGVLYILDEPTIGLHYRDNKRLLNALKQLRDRGNTVIVVEHDEETMRSVASI